eukprot:SAG31_NODE_32818_length_351_cov_0.821429_1_plen_25_part_10
MINLPQSFTRWMARANPCELTAQVN